MRLDDLMRETARRRDPEGAFALAETMRCAGARYQQIADLAAKHGIPLAEWDALVEEGEALEALK